VNNNHLKLTYYDPPATIKSNYDPQETIKFKYDPPERILNIDMTLQK